MVATAYWGTVAWFAAVRASVPTVDVIEEIERDLVSPFPRLGYPEGTVPRLHAAPEIWPIEPGPAWGSYGRPRVLGLAWGAPPLLPLVRRE